MPRNRPSDDDMIYIRIKLRELMAREFGGTPQDYWVFGPDDSDDPLRKMLEEKEDDRSDSVL